MSDTLYTEEELANMQDMFSEPSDDLPPKITQEGEVKMFLAEHGYISRNWCLSKYITRLSAIIHTMVHKEGYVFEDRRVIKNKNAIIGDYVYELKKGAYDDDRSRT